ncbi:MAG: hypothetical protein ACOYLS_01430 [Polymorphobacter sp.]
MPRPSPKSPRHTARLVHFKSPVGEAPHFFMAVSRDGDPKACQRLFPLDLEAVAELLRSFETAMALHQSTRRSQLLATERMVGHA